MEWYHANKKKAKKSQRKYYLKNREKIAKKNRTTSQELRKKVLEKLGNKCKHCGFDDWRALQIDHVNGDGLKEDGQSRARAFANKVLNDKVGKYQLLCANCNWIKRYEKQETTLGKYRN